MSMARAGEISALARRSLMARRKSGILDSGDPADGLNEIAPAITLRGENFFPRRRKPVITASALPRFLDPPAPNPTAFLESIKQGIKRGDIEAERAARSQLDQLADVVPVARSIFDQ